MCRADDYAACIDRLGATRTQIVLRAARIAEIGVYECIVGIVGSGTDNLSGSVDAIRAATAAVVWSQRTQVDNRVRRPGGDGGGRDPGQRSEGTQEDAAGE